MTQSNAGRKPGRMYPRPVRVNLDEATHGSLVELAIQADRSVSGMARMLLTEALRDVARKELEKEQDLDG